PFQFGPRRSLALDADSGTSRSTLIHDPAARRRDSRGDRWGRDEDGGRENSRGSARCLLHVTEEFQHSLMRRGIRDPWRWMMPRGDKSKYSDKQKRKAEHIEESYESRGTPDSEAERRAWATVNKESGG